MQSNLHEPWRIIRLSYSKVGGKGSVSENGWLLETRGLTKRFGGLVAVDSLPLAIRPGEVRGLIGPNGSGKTTINLLSGLYRLTLVRSICAASALIVSARMRSRHGGGPDVSDPQAVWEYDGPGEWHDPSPGSA